MPTSQLSLEDITIRTFLKSGDLGYLTYLHGILYQQEYGYTMAFESYVAAGLNEFYQQYTDARNRVWVAEHNGKMVGFLLTMDRGEWAQLRYFLITPGYRGLGLGKKLLRQSIEFLVEVGYSKTYLWTTHEQTQAAQLYRNVGFVLSEEKESDAFGKPLREQRYDLLL
ncbi:GNAT family N-acetyltransferase [Rufibacter latericius]|uniref:GNAT family N-acetyltransferase n=1 Tax=Rufibacter latericius TaxID=2487040 RepID=A0A3M9N0E4_9BACT|nr:GNAT family N-acetyltransferase [Rufibacter latericius]RNI30613.1 GNAT family N-acetyltransferase [Rufibacter latericius]